MLQNAALLQETAYNGLWVGQLFASAPSSNGFQDKFGPARRQTTYFLRKDILKGFKSSSVAECVPRKPGKEVNKMTEQVQEFTSVYPAVRSSP